MVVKFNHLLPAMPELGMGLPNAYSVTSTPQGCCRRPNGDHAGRTGPVRIIRLWKSY